MNIGVIAFTSRGYDLGTVLCAKLETAGHEANLYRCGNETLAQWTSQHFYSNEALIYIGAAGIAVRAISPYVKSKTTDPAVLVVDELGRFVIPILSGHIGGANELSMTVANLLDAIPVITTATDCNGVFAVDSWAKKHQLTILNPKHIKLISARLLAGQAVRLQSAFPLSGPLPQGIVLDHDNADMTITIKQNGLDQALKLVPPALTLGVGCRRGTQFDDLNKTFASLLENTKIYKEAICQVCSIDLKADEPGLLEFCKSQNLPFKTFKADELNAVQGEFTASEFVKRTTGTDNVCERSAVLGSGGTLLTKKDAGNGITMALAIAPYTVHFPQETTDLQSQS